MKTVDIVSGGAGQPLRAVPWGLGLSPPSRPRMGLEAGVSPGSGGSAPGRIPALGLDAQCLVGLSRSPPARPGETLRPASCVPWACRWLALGSLGFFSRRFHVLPTDLRSTRPGSGQGFAVAPQAAGRAAELTHSCKHTDRGQRGAGAGSGGGARSSSCRLGALTPVRGHALRTRKRNAEDGTCLPQSLRTAPRVEVSPGSASPGPRAGEGDPPAAYDSPAAASSFWWHSVTPVPPDCRRRASRTFLTCPGPSLT